MTSFCDILLLCFSIGTKTMCPLMYRLTLASILFKVDTGCTPWRLQSKEILNNLTNSLSWNVALEWDLQNVNIPLGGIRDIKSGSIRDINCGECCLLNVEAVLVYLSKGHTIYPSYLSGYSFYGWVRKVGHLWLLFLSICLMSTIKHVKIYELTVFQIYQNSQFLLKWRTEFRCPHLYTRKTFNSTHLPRGKILHSLCIKNTENIRPYQQQPGFGNLNTGRWPLKIFYVIYNFYKFHIRHLFIEDSKLVMNIIR